MSYRRIPIRVDHQLGVHSAGHAVVIGGSMAGLLASRVLADHFDQVTIIERDLLPERPDFRKGIPQAHHAHVLLMRGQMILEQLFPGLDAELAAAGAPVVDWAADCQCFHFGGWKPRCRSGVASRTCSRNLLEWTVRRRLTASSKVRFLEACDVTGLLSDTSRTRVTGVGLHFRNQLNQENRREEELSANLVVDASGRNSRTPQWLDLLGYPPSQETVVNSFLGYASRCYQRPTGLEVDWKLLVQQATPPTSSRGGLLFPIEGDRWILTLAGAAHDYPPTDEAAFLTFARSLPSPILYEAIKDAQVLSPIYGYRRTENRLRHYEQLPRWPENFVVIGDAVCAFNPVYGQGMTVCTQSALLLDQCLRDQRRYQPKGELTGFSRRFQQKLAKSIATPWLIATGEDFRYPETQGRKTDWMTRLLQRYLDQVMLIANENLQVYRVVLKVVHLLKPPTVLFQWGILIQVLKGAINRRRRNKQRGLDGAVSTVRIQV